jgi:titin
MTRIIAALVVFAGVCGAASVEAGVGRLDLTWTDNATDETGFTVERASGPCAAPTSAFSVLAASLPVNTTAYADTNLAPGTTWCYRVRAFNGAGNSAYSNSANGTTTAIPSAPTGLTIAMIEGTVAEDPFVDSPGRQAPATSASGSGGGSPASAPPTGNS